MYGSAMGKQARSQQYLNMEHRVESTSQSLCYPQIPMVQTYMEEILGTTHLPMGMTFRIAVMCYKGYNQEDSLILNQSSLEMGLARSYVRRAYRDEERNKGADPTKFEKLTPGSCRGMRPIVYSKVGDCGWAEPGTEIDPDDAVICKSMNTEELPDPDAPPRPVPERVPGGGTASV